MTLVGFKAQNHPQQRSKDEVDDRAITLDDFNAIARRLGPFTVDVAAAAHNARCERYFTVDDDGLAQSWAGEAVWCNPPYSNIRPWVEKAWRERALARRIVMLLPANRTEQAWWQEGVEPYRRDSRWFTYFRVEFLPGRMRFVRPNAVIGPKGDRPPFGCCLLIWGSEDES
jgi:phage N-6-adenine-methyltransferase